MPTMNRLDYDQNVTLLNDSWTAFALANPLAGGKIAYEKDTALDTKVVLFNENYSPSPIFLHGSAASYLVRPVNGVIVDTLGNPVTNTGVTIVDGTPSGLSGFGDVMYFDGNASLQLPHISIGDGQDFSIEWMYNLSVGGSMITARETSGTYGMTFNHAAAYFTNNISVGNPPYVATPQFGYAANQWNHAAITRVNGFIKTYCNGVLSETTANQNNALYTGGVTVPLCIGRDLDGGWPITGYMAEIRISIGTALRTSNFPMPTSRYTA